MNEKVLTSKERSPYEMTVTDALRVTERYEYLRTLPVDSPGTFFWALVALGDEVRRLRATATPIAEALRQVGDETDWRDGDETDRVYTWREIEPLWKALAGASPDRIAVHAPNTLWTIRNYPCGCRAEGPGDVPAYCSNHGTVETGDESTKVANLLRALDAKQAKIDALMMEFCPGEMSKEQRDEWAKHQQPVSADVERSITESFRRSPRRAAETECKPCEGCHGSGEIVTNERGGDPEWDQSRPCAECEGTPLRELQWIRELVRERERAGNDIPPWLALEWVNDAIRKVSALKAGG